MYFLSSEINMQYQIATDLPSGKRQRTTADTELGDEDAQEVTFDNDMTISGTSKNCYLSLFDLS
jgi:hypothetical protein